jgi:hypothetical protein
VILTFSCSQLSIQLSNLVLNIHLNRLPKNKKIEGNSLEKIKEKMATDLKAAPKRDGGVKNRSSIAFIMKVPTGGGPVAEHTVAMTGDANAIEAFLPLYEKSAEKPLKYDVMKGT